MPNIGKNIKKFRKKKNISQDRLSKLANVSLNLVAKLELENNQNPTIETLQKIADALDVSIEDLIK